MKENCISIHDKNSFKNVKKSFAGSKLLWCISCCLWCLFSITSLKSQGTKKQTRRDMMMTNMCEEKCSISDWYQFPTYYILANLKYSSFINENVIFLSQTSITLRKVDRYLTNENESWSWMCFKAGVCKVSSFHVSALFAYITFETTEKGKKRQQEPKSRWW